MMQNNGVGELSLELEMKQWKLLSDTITSKEQAESLVWLLRQENPTIYIEVNLTEHNGLFCLWYRQIDSPEKHTL